MDAIKQLIEAGYEDLAEELKDVTVGYRPINVEKAAKIIDNWTNSVAHFQDRIDNIYRGFKQAKKELDGLRKAGAGVTEADTLLETHVLKPIEELQASIDRFDKVIHR